MIRSCIHNIPATICPRPRRSDKTRRPSSNDHTSPVAVISLHLLAWSPSESVAGWSSIIDNELTRPDKWVLTVFKCRQCDNPEDRLSEIHTLTSTSLEVWISVNQMIENPSCVKYMTFISLKNDLTKTWHEKYYFKYCFQPYEQRLKMAIRDHG